MTILRALFLLFAISTSAIAADMHTSNIWNGTEMKLGAGILNGESSSIYYDVDGSTYGLTDYKFGESVWKLDDVPMAGIGFSASVGKSVRISFDYWLNTTDGGGGMKDYLWRAVGYDWSDRSQHSDTTVRKAEMIDISAEYIFADTSEGRERNYWSAVVGYRRDFFDWQARGGSAIWSSPGYRDTSVLFADIPLFTYKQTFTVPYIGVQYNTFNHTRDGRLSSRFYLQYSPLASGEDELVSTMGERYTEANAWKYEGEMSGGGWYRFGLEMNFEITKQIMLTLGYTLQQYNEIKGKRKETDLVGGTTTQYPEDSASMENQYNMFTLGMNYRF